MISNYYIIHQVVGELQKEVLGSAFLRATSIHPGELQLHFDEATIYAVLNPAQGTIYKSSQQSSSGPKRNSISFFEELSDKKLTAINIAEFDKKITFGFDEYELVLRFYDSPNAQLFHQGNQIAAFKKEAPIKQVSTAPPKPLSPLREICPMLSKQLEREFFARFLKDEPLTDLAIHAKAFDTELRKSSFALLYESPSVLLSPITLREFDRNTAREVSTSEGIELILRTRRKRQSVEHRKKLIAEKLQSLHGRTMKAIADAEHGIEETSRSERYRAIATAIGMQAYELQKGTTEIEFEFEGTLQKAALEPTLTSYENAKKYFDKARKSDEAKLDRIARLEKLKINEQLLSSLIAQLQLLDSPSKLDSFDLTLKRQSFLLEKADESAERSGDKLDRFRRFQVAGGLEVLVGKNAKQNDELTMKIATKEDLWFHARHVSGSHVLLRTAGRKDIPHDAILQAAALAAHFSDAKTQGLAPVAYTKRKFVRKRKGAAPGEVVIEREEVIMVVPKLTSSE